METNQRAIARRLYELEVTGLLDSVWKEKLLDSTAATERIEWQKPHIEGVFEQIEDAYLQARCAMELDRILRDMQDLAVFVRRAAKDMEKRADKENEASA